MRPRWLDSPHPGPWWVPFVVITLAAVVGWTLGFVIVVALT